MTFGPIDAVPWGYKPADGWPHALNAPLVGIELGAYDVEIIRWAASTLDGPTLTVLTSLLHRARAAAPLVEDEEVMP